MKIISAHCASSVLVVSASISACCSTASRPSLFAISIRFAASCTASSWCAGTKSENGAFGAKSFCGPSASSAFGAIAAAVSIARRSGARLRRLTARSLVSGPSGMTAPFATSMADDSHRGDDEHQRDADPGEQRNGREASDGDDRARADCKRARLQGERDDDDERDRKRVEQRSGRQRDPRCREQRQKTERTLRDRQHGERSRERRSTRDDRGGLHAQLYLGVTGDGKSLPESGGQTILSVLLTIIRGEAGQAGLPVLHECFVNIETLCHSEPRRRRGIPRETTLLAPQAGDPS